MYIYIYMHMPAAMRRHVFRIVYHIIARAQTHTHTCIYMVIDLKVLVRSFNCESRECYVGNPRESFFFELAKVKFYFAKVSRKLGIIIII